MEQYTIHLVRNWSVITEAPTAHEAIKIAEEHNPESRAEYISCPNGESFDVDMCNGCGTKMLEYEIGGSDFDGDYYCKDCYGAMQVDYLNWLHELTTLGYDNGLIIAANIKENVNELYSEGKSPIEALEILQKKAN